MPEKPPAPAGDRTHLVFVDGLRALAALYVVCVHLLPRAWDGADPRSLPLRLAAKVLAQGHFAVTTFIVVSGFCLMLPLLRSGLQFGGGLPLFVRRRFLRIAPPFYLAFALSALLVPLTVNADTGRPFTLSEVVTLPRVFAHAAFLQTVVTDGLLTTNGVLWSVGVEWWIYFLFPPLVTLWRRAGGVTATLTAVGAGYAVMLLVQRTPLAGFVPHYAGLFALGAFGAAVALDPSPAWERWRTRIPWLGMAAVAYLLVAGMCLGLGWRRAETYVNWLDLPVSLAAVGVLVGATRPGAIAGLLRAVLGWRPLAFVGAFSYSLYLVHYPLISVLVDHAVKPLRLGQTAVFALLLLAVLPLVLALSYLFFLAFERPFHALARRAGAAARTNPAPTAAAEPQRAAG
jgi:peptidoglycan/LPS O-acetylase OafA/YrhL